MPDGAEDIILSTRNTFNLHCRRRRLLRRSQSDSNIYYHSLLDTVERLIRFEFYYLVSKATWADIERRKQFARLQRRLRQQIIVEETVASKMPQSRRMAVRRQAIYRRKTTIIVSTTTLVMIVTIAAIVTIFLLWSPDIEQMICEQSNHLYGEC